MSSQSSSPLMTAAQRAHPPHTLPTRVIHATLLLMVLHQLIGNQFMHRPPAGQPVSWVWTLHEYVGLVGVVVVAAFWVWAFVRHGDTRLGRLVPWFSISGARAVLSDILGQFRRVARLRLPDEGTGALASAIHGLGLIIVSVMVGTGAVYFFADPSIGHSFLLVHKLFANLMWAYLIAHAALAVLHHLIGSDIFSRMFLPRRGDQVAETN